MFTQLIQRNHPEFLLEDFWPGFKTLQHKVPPSQWGALDIAEHKDHYEFSADFPGVLEKDIRIEFTAGELTLEAERKSAMTNTQVEGETKAEFTVLRSERGEQKFRRVFDLGDAVDGEKIEAHFRDGVLTLKVPKAEKSKPRTIPIRIAS